MIRKRYWIKFFYIKRKLCLRAIRISKAKWGTITPIFGRLALRDFPWEVNGYLGPIRCSISSEMCSLHLAQRFPMSGATGGGAYKFLARPGRTQATATKLGIYSKYSPRSSIHFLASYSNFCKPLKKKIQKVVRPTRSPRQHWTPRRTKNGNLSIARSGE